MENTQASNKKYALIAIISIVVLLALFAAGYFLVKYYKGKSSATLNKEGAKAAVEVKGTLFLSMLPNDVKEGVPLTYSIDAATAAITPLYQDLMKSDNLYISHTSLSPNKKFFVTGGIKMDEKPETAGNATALYVGQYNGAVAGLNDEKIVAKFGTASGAKGLAYRNPSVGDHGGLLYAVPPKGVKDINFDWEIHYNALGQDARVAFGLSPKWISANEFVYVTKKGIRSHNLTTGFDTVVESFIDKSGKPFPVQTNMMIGVSKDGKQLAFSNPESYEVYIFRKDGDRFMLNKTVKGFGFWPTFSPDGKVLALQTLLDIAQRDKSAIPRIVFFDIEADEPMMLDKYVDLGVYKNDVLFINDWN